MKRFAVIGLGLLGRTVARELSQRGAEVIAIDLEQDLVDAVADHVALAVRLDSTNRDALLSQGIDKVDAAVIAIGENFQAAVLTTALVKEFGVPRVISRAVTEDEAKILKLVKADEVILVEEWVARKLSQSILSPSLMDVVELGPGLSLGRIRASKEMWGKSLAAVKFRQRYGLSVVAMIKAVSEGRQTPETLIPDPEAIIDQGDVLLVEGDDEAIERLASEDKD